MLSGRWSRTTKLIVSALLILLLLALLITFRVMLVPTILACLVAFVLHHPVNWIQRRTGWARGASIIATYLLLALLLSIVPALFLPLLLNSVASLQDLTQELLTGLSSAAPTLQIADYTLDVNTLLLRLSNSLQTALSAVAAGAVGFVLDVTTGILTGLYAFILAYWLLRDWHKLQRWLLERIPPDYQTDARLLGGELAAIWEGFLRGQIVLALVIGSLVWVLMAIVGVPNAGGLALLAAAMEFLPSIGPAISGWIGTAVALLQGSTWLPMPNLAFAVLVAVLYFIVAQLENLIFAPRLVGGRVNLDPLVALVGVMAATVVFGFLGVLLAMPVMASARTILTYVYHKLRDEEPFAPMRGEPVVRVPGIVAGQKIEGVLFVLDGPLVARDWRWAERVAQHTARLDRFLDYEERRQIARQILRGLEGWSNHLINLLRWLRRQRVTARLQPPLDRLRSLAPVEEARSADCVQTLLRHLAPGYRLGLVTVRNRQDVHRLLARLDLPIDLFTCVVSRDDVRRLPPHTDAFRTAIDCLDLEPEALLVVSDSEVHLRPARALGMTTVGIAADTEDERQLRSADLILAAAGELEDWL